MGYDIYDSKKKIKNFVIEPGVYLAFSDEKLFKDKNEGGLIDFIYKSKVFLIRKKLALERKL